VDSLQFAAHTSHAARQAPEIGRSAAVGAAKAQTPLFWSLFWSLVCATMIDAEVSAQAGYGLRGPHTDVRPHGRLSPRDGSGLRLSRCAWAAARNLAMETAENGGGNHGMIQADVGNRDFPLWLIGDANLTPGKTGPFTPVDARHRVWHMIWTPVLHVIEDRVYRGSRLRMDTRGIHFRNILADLALKPEPAYKEWSPATDSAVAGLRSLLVAHRPVILVSFGAFAFEAVRRALAEHEWHPHGWWSAKRLGDEFRKRIRDFEPGESNVLPLLHRRISGSAYMESYEHFIGEAGGDYFEVVGAALAETLLRYRRQLPIWIEDQVGAEV
jgi:hypothetical protein